VHGVSFSHILFSTLMLTLSSFTRISEDSSEIVFLLVENYQLTAPRGPSRDR
jgi:hypothetical protein